MVQQDGCDAIGILLVDDEHAFRAGEALEPPYLRLLEEPVDYAVIHVLIHEIASA